MRSILEFALFAWVGISVFAVLVQLFRIARYKRANRSVAEGPVTASKAEAPTINLEQRLAPSINAPPAAVSVPAQAMAAAPVVEHAAAQATTVMPPSTAPSVAPSTAPAPPAPSITNPSAVPTNVDPVAAVAQTEPAAPTLADLLAGVRLPWNLLPTVDQSREPSNDRVVLITSEGEPADIGIDVADELERLGFAIAPRGDDTAVATRNGHSLGMQIIPDPQAAQVDGTPRFPTATESSVALDIWIDS